MEKKNNLKTVEIPSTSLPILTEADVVVAGGGNAGFIAATAAQRSGAKTVLVERYGYLAGSLTGTYASSPGFFGDSEGRQVIKGIGWEFIERMEKAGAAIVDRENWVVQTFPEAAKTVALDMVLEAGVDLFLHTWAGETLVEDQKIVGLIVQSKSGRGVIRGKVFVDATGDADLAWMSGAPTEKLPADQLWQTSVDLVVCNVDAARVVEWAKQNEGRIIWMSMPDGTSSNGIQPMVSLLIPSEQAAEDGECLHVGPVPTVKLMIHPSISRVQGSVEIDGTDVHDLTYAEVEARRRALTHLAFLKATVPGYENAFVVGECHLGVRETRRIQGEYLLTVDDLLNQARFDDVVALNCRALDQHIKGEVFKFQVFEGNHDIPLRSLIPKEVVNLLVAGRCISSDHLANASLRGAATCLATGHAAGTAAALAAQGNGYARGIDVLQLQRWLQEQGAILHTD